MTYLCVPIFVTDLDKARRDVATAAEAGADLVELRIDGYQGLWRNEALGKLSLPYILTCRPKWEGGKSELSDTVRLGHLLHSPQVDVELKSAIEFRELFDQIRTSSDRVILSTHDFAGRPEKLYSLLNEMNSFNADINKIVWTARSIRDNLEAFEIVLQRQRPTIALCMGEAGILSRVLARKFGAYLTFASLDSESATAPGQISIGDMKNLYRWNALGPETRVFGVVACPVAHSMSPAIHNAAFAETSYNGIYLPMLVQPGYESFKAFMETFLDFKPLDLRGLSITIPHKENALRYLQEKGAEVEDLAKSIGAINTIDISPTKLAGFNTDYAAIIDSITTALGIDRKGLANLRVGIIGAGGTGRTAVAALSHFGARVSVSNRNAVRAKGLADEFHVQAVELGDLCETDWDVVVNTTSIGMHPHMDEHPAPKLHIRPGMLVFDAVYNPPETRFLRDAKSAGAKTISGVEMFVRQAVRQFEIWTGQPAPVQVMRDVIEKRLTKTR